MLTLKNKINDHDKYDKHTFATIKMITAILVVPKHEILSMRGDAQSIVIAISDPHHEVVLQEGWAQKLRLHFHDATRPQQSVQLFSEDHARLIREFCMKWHKDHGRYRLVINCDYGLSRSAAVALCIARQLNVPVETYSAASRIAEERSLPVADVADWGVVSPNFSVLAKLYPPLTKEFTREQCRLMLLKQDSVGELLPL